MSIYRNETTSKMEKFLLQHLLVVLACLLALL